MKSSMHVLAGLALVSTLTLAPAVSATADVAARDMCTTPRTDTVTTTQGQRVWIPSSRSAGPFQWGGSQSISTTDGSMSSTTESHSNTLGGSGGLTFPVWNASAHYDREWGKSTTTEQSYSQTFTTDSGTVSRSIQWRWRMYMKGYLFKATRTTTYPVPCRVTKRWVTKKFIVPATGRDYTFNLERYSNKGAFLRADGTPFRL